MQVIRNSLRHNGMQRQFQDGHKSPAGLKHSVAVTHFMHATYAAGRGRLQDGQK